MKLLIDSLKILKNPSVIVANLFLTIPVWCVFALKYEEEEIYSRLILSYLGAWLFVLSAEFVFIVPLMFLHKKFYYEGSLLRSSKTMSWIRKNKCLLWRVIPLGIIAFILFAKIIKVTDPSDPRFNPDRFSFADYGRDEVRDVLKKLFPIGTSREYVDRVLVSTGAATVSGSDPQRIKYRETFHFFGKEWRQYSILGVNGLPFHMFFYDKENRLLNIKAHSGRCLYKGGVADIPACKPR